MVYTVSTVCQSIHAGHPAVCSITVHFEHILWKSKSPQVISADTLTLPFRVEKSSRDLTKDLSETPGICFCIIFQ